MLICYIFKKNSESEFIPLTQERQQLNETHKTSASY